MVTLTIDGKKITISDGSTIIQACEEAGIEIPRFCYHSRLNIAGNCRMCLVEVEKIPKPVASCSQPVSEDMIVHTNSPMVKKAREGVMEFLLINHPLDCPICDQGGECDLQDQAMTYGKGTSRYKEEKRAVEDKNFGPLVKTHMTRCIHCTRCVRFLSDVAGTTEMGAVFRGEDMEITTALEKAITSELSGNIVDLCPVGALTSKPFEYKARSWELEKTESIDVLDAVGSNIRVDSRGLEVMRILPRLNEDINEEWISDKTRFACDGLNRQRIDAPYIKENGKFYKITWQEAMEVVKENFSKFKPSEMAAIAGNLADLESMFVLKDIFHSIGSYNIDCRVANENITNTNRSDYIFNTTISGIEEADYCLIIGANPRKEAAILNARIRKANIHKKLKVGLIGTKVNLNYDYDYLGEDISILEEILNGKHRICEFLTQAKKPMLILGTQVLSHSDGAEIHALAKLIAEKYHFVSENWNGFNVLQTAAARVGGMDIGFLPTKDGLNVKQISDQADLGKIKLVYLLNADELNFHKFQNSFVIYQGHHVDEAANHADLLLPGCAYTEKEASYVNLEGRLQKTKRAVFAPNEAKVDVDILFDIAKQLNISLKYKNITELREEISKFAPQLSEYNRIRISPFVIDKRDYNCITKVISYSDSNYFLTDPISRSSVTMAKCAAIEDQG